MESTDTPKTPLALEQETVMGGLASLGFDLQPYTIDKSDFEAWLLAANYDNYPKYYLKGLSTKFLDHYLGAKFLNLPGGGSVYIDVASSLTSPVAEIYSQLYGCDSYRQDLLFPAGLNGRTIGGDAANMPLPADFADGLGLHSSFEHFEGDADIRFLAEAGRVLKPGRRMVIVPLFLASRYQIKTDPAVWPKEGMYFDGEAAILYKDWKNRFSRFYDPVHLETRIRRNLGALKLTIHVMQNDTEIVPGSDRKFVAVFEKAGG